MDFLAFIFLLFWKDMNRRNATSERAKERGHRELLDAVKKKRKSNRQTVTRNLAKDKYGNVLAQDVIEDNYEDEYDANVVDLDKYEIRKKKKQALLKEFAGGTYGCGYDD